MDCCIGWDCVHTLSWSVYCCIGVDSCGLLDCVYVTSSMLQMFGTAVHADTVFLHAKHIVESDQCLWERVILQQRKCCPPCYHGQPLSVQIPGTMCRSLKEVQPSSFSFSHPLHLQDTATSTDSPKATSSHDKEESHTPKSLSPSVSPVHSRPHTPTPSNGSTPSPTSPSPTFRREGPRHLNSDPRPASINLPAFRPQGDVVKPKFMINDVPASPPSIQGPIEKYSVESFVGGPPNASIHVSLGLCVCVHANACV